MRASHLLRSGSYAAAGQRSQLVRALCIFMAIAQLPLFIGLYRQSEWATNLWPLPDARMTYHFLASIVATTATLLGWAAWRNELAGIQTIGIVAGTATPGIGLYFLWLGVDRDESNLVVASVVFLAFGAIFAALGLWSRQLPVNDPRSLPSPFRIVFVGFCCILIPVGIALVAQVENVFPWTLSPENSTVIGLVFLGASILFGWIVAHPRWAYGEMALTGFLAYDLALFLPYLDLMRNRNDTETISSYYDIPGYAPVSSSDSGINELSLMIYLAVMVVSAVAAIGIYVWGYMSRPVAQAAVAD